ncbi:MAG: 2-keto-4-pentenoate hydratase [Aquabacterium sp.]
MHITDPDATATAAARLLWQHWQAGTKLDGLPPALRPANAAAGHAVQARLPHVAGADVEGWKIAATSAAGQAHIGVNGPLPGRLLAGRVHGDGARLSLAGNAMCVAEPEFVFRFGRSLAPRAVPYGVDEVLAAVAALHPGLEVPDSRYTDFVRAGEAQLLADDACAHLFVLGPASTADWRALGLRAQRVDGRVSRGGVTHLRRQGDGSAVLGDPRVALAWLVNALSVLGVPLQAGQFVTTGTCMQPLALAPGDQVLADFGVLGSVSASFVE